MNVAEFPDTMMARFVFNADEKCLDSDTALHDHWHLCSGLEALMRGIGCRLRVMWGEIRVLLGGLRGLMSRMVAESSP